MIAEFRAMLAAFPPKARAPQVHSQDSAQRTLPRPVHWDGEHFFGYVTEREKETEFWFRAHRNGITVGFSQPEWAAVQELFRRAWENPELRLSWDALTLEYGEL